MEKMIEQALHLRKEGQLLESNRIFLQLVKEFPQDAYINYQCAWSFDTLGDESQAVPFYETAISLGLPEKDQEGAFIGLGSTYRTLGEYDKSQKTLEQGLKQFPTNRAMQVFLAMTLYNLESHQQAMELLLKNIMETSNDEDIQSYKKAIEFYSNKLDQTWK
ncbi:tetratricopeptide repeat protein [Psychrobacillus sp. BL-248-WT-3]|uniref:tetratricopeptide repeat protein n=1 Tax=Psychrobacillus sp. BL-248-WT-3 TaxID=2725306 RepID=UPI00146A34AD|nr:tetratricopeptide repeat protein [Psychrobacillus sp. BL-248-WT-3]NME05412.1 tetratricopeptide repeat protein [Psychrobacillus sp. BL-248-WT-3]